MNINKMQKYIKRSSLKSSQWQKGILKYALEILENCKGRGKEITSLELLKKACLNGAENWLQYSEGGCSLIYNSDICKRLMTPSERKRFKNRIENGEFDCIAMQARALFQAFWLVKNAFEKLYLK